MVKFLLIIIFGCLRRAFYYFGLDLEFYMVAELDDCYHCQLLLINETYDVFA